MPTQASFHGGVGNPSRIDGVFADRRTARYLKHVSSITTCSLPGHTAVVYVLQLECPRQMVTKLRRLPKFIISSCTESDATPTGLVVAKRYAARVEHAVTRKDVDQLWGIWSRMAEETLTALSAPADQQAKNAGRGTRKMFQRSTLAPQRHSDSGGPKSAKAQYW